MWSLYCIFTLLHMLFRSAFVDGDMLTSTVICYQRSDVDRNTRTIKMINCDETSTNHNRSNQTVTIERVDITISHLLRVIDPHERSEEKYEASKEDDLIVIPPYPRNNQSYNATDQKSVYPQFAFAIPSAICASPTVQLFIGSTSTVTNATGRIFFPLDDTIPDIPFELGPNEGDFFHFSLNAVLHDDDFNSKVYTAAAIEADVPIHAYGHHHCTPSTHRSDAFRLLPIEQLGVDYWVLTFQNAGVSQVAITAIDNDTVVKIALDSRMVSTMLNQFETYYLGGMYDSSGMRVQANKPVCVLAGNSFDKSDDVDTNGGDPFYECLIPVSKWSNSYSIVRYPSLEELSVLRIITPFTDAFINYPDVGVNIISTTGGEVLTDLELNHVTNSSMYFTSAKPFLLAHFTTPRPLPTSGGILSMFYVPSAKQATSSKFTFPIFSLPVDILTAYLHVWIPHGFSFSDLFVNSAITYDWEMIATDIEGFQIAQLSNLNNGSYYVIDSKGAFNFCGVVYVSAYKQYYAFPL